MLDQYAFAYVSIVDVLDDLIRHVDEFSRFPIPQTAEVLAYSIRGKEPPLPEAIRIEIDTSLQKLKSLLDLHIPFASVIAQIDRISIDLKREGPKVVSSRIEDLKSRLMDELKGHEFMHVSPEFVRYYNQPMLFGQNVNDHLPKAIDDIEEAGKCLALGRGTACVMHTMRVMEVGLRALANALGIPYAPSWESYLKQIRDKIAEPYDKKPPEWKMNEKFYRDLSGDLFTIKQAWRNPTMHVDRKYSVEEALQIFQASGQFMARLAAHFSKAEFDDLLK
jgi:hypothetical protein